MDRRLRTRSSARSCEGTSPLAGWRVLALVAGAAVAPACGAAVCRVSSTGASGNDGSAWSQAMTIQAALGGSHCSEVWVAQGAYHPSPAADRGASFVIRPGVELYGGFAGTEGARDQRDAAIHPTVLSGDIDGNDDVDEYGVTRHADGIVGDNSFHVVLLGGAAGADVVLDGFILSGGRADDTGTPDGAAGGGLLCSASGVGQECSPTLRNLVFRGNFAVSGGGLACVAQDQGLCGAALDAVAFLNNVSGNGGGMASYALTGGVARPALDNATFSGNRAEYSGGALIAAGFDGGTNEAQLRNATFSANSAQGVGAIFNTGWGGTSTTAVSGSILWGNSALEAMSEAENGQLRFDRSLVRGGCPPGATCTGLVTGDPKLGALQPVGGIAPAHPLGENSSAFDAIPCDDVPVRDPRGLARPQGAACDLGAVEVRQATVTVSVSGGGKVNALAVPPALGAAIVGCGPGQGACTGRYRVEPVAPDLVLLLKPDVGHVAQSATGCGGSRSGNTYGIAALTADCATSVAFAPASHRIGGTVTGLAGNGLVLSLDGAESLPIGADGSFVFSTGRAFGAAYEVTVRTQPTQPSQTCVVLNGSGTVGTSDVTDVVVHCGAAATYTVGGTLGGLAAGGSVALSVNGGPALVLAANGSYAFAPRFLSGDAYAVSLLAQPAGQHCSLSNAAGVVGSADVTHVDVTCAAGGAELTLAVSDDNSFARHGEVRKYVVTLTNSGNDVAAGVAVRALLDAAFDEANVRWSCIDGAPGASCTPQGAGAFADTATLPAGTRLVWIVNAPIRGDGNAAEATFLVRADGAPDASDTDTLVLFRDGVDRPYGSGSNAPAAPGDGSAGL